MLHTSNLDIALSFAERGFVVFPCDHYANPKRPKLKWTQEATSNPEMIRRMWKKWPNALVALPTGKINGIIVLDIDRKNGVDGFVSLREIGFDYGSYEGFKVRTPSGGVHLYFSYREHVRNSVNWHAPGLDVRSDGGYVIAGGSIPDLGAYEVCHV